MKTALRNPWAALLKQVWLYQQANTFAVRCIESRPMHDPLALSGPSGKVLNPLEFHGKRRSPTPRRAPTGDHAASVGASRQEHGRVH